VAHAMEPAEDPPVRAWQDPPLATFPRGELYLACGLALALRLAYLVGVAQSPLFLHPVLEGNPQHPYAWFLAAITGLTGGDPLAIRVIQALLDSASVFFLGAAAHEIWGRRSAVFTAEVAALFGPLIYFASDLSPATLSFFVVSVAMYWCARVAKSSGAGIIMAGLALACAMALAIQGGPAAAAGAAREGMSVPHFFSNMALVWNRREAPCGVMDQAFFAPFHSPIFRLPWLLAFALVGPIALVTAWKERRTAPLFGGTLICVTLALAATHVCDRTRLALLAGALPLAGRGVDHFLLAFDRAAAKAHSWLGATLFSVAWSHAGMVMALGVAAAFVVLPFPHLQRTHAGEGWLAIARAYVATENPREAQRAYDQAEKSGLRTSEFYAEWGKLESEKRLGILAAQHLLTAVQLDPENPAAHESLGDVYRAREEFDLAGQEYAVAAMLVPGRAAELDTRAGECYLDGKDANRAREMFERALHESPGYEAAQAGLDRIRHPGRPPQPVKMFELNPSSGR